MWAVVTPGELLHDQEPDISIMIINLWLMEGNEWMKIAQGT